MQTLLGGALISVCTAAIPAYVPLPTSSGEPSPSRPSIYASSGSGSFGGLTGFAQVASPVVDLTVRDGNGTVTVVEDLEEEDSIEFEIQLAEGETFDQLTSTARGSCRVRTVKCEWYDTDAGEWTAQNCTMTRSSNSQV